MSKKTISRIVIAGFLVCFLVLLALLGSWYRNKAAEAIFEQEVAAWTTTFTYEQNVSIKPSTPEEKAFFLEATQKDVAGAKAGLLSMIKGGQYKQKKWRAIYESNLEHYKANCIILKELQD